MATETVDPSGAEAFAGRLFQAAVATFDLLGVYLGDRLGLYRALHAGGPATAGELAARAGVDARYAREWLEQQAVSAILAVDDAGADPEARRYRLPGGHAAALVDPDSPFSAAPLARALVACAAALPAVRDAFRDGGGVPWAAYGQDGVEAQGDANRPWLRSELTGAYLPAVPDVHARLLAAPPARVADVACGVGWAGVAIATAYPGVRVDGFDVDEASIGLARRHAAEAGVADRTGFEVRDVPAAGLPGAYDLAVVIEAVHDMARPVEALAAIRRALAPGGSAIVADERSADVFTAPGDEVERYLYGCSVTCCLPASMAERPSAATGTVMRAGTLRRYAAEAGFRAVEVLDAIDHPMLRFYRLLP
jgi:2-polyprenyl-3-methyl-5-hydroxy-6-metoxy-1,4-benzoquinol methylase